MDKRFFVRIEVPTFVDNGQDRDGAWGATGTGYPVGEGLILTARHVVRPEQRNKGYPIRVRWHSFPGWGAKSDGVVELDGDDDKAIVWEGGEETDIALIHCPQTPEPVAPVRFLGRLPRDGDRWKSIGFPRATLFAEGRSQNSFGGEIRAPNEPWFEICDSHAPKTAEDWKGASGMPIFVDGRIIGVFSASLEYIEGKAHAIPIQPLLVEDGTTFRERVGYDDQLEAEWRAYRKAVARDVAAYLERFSGAREALLPLVDCPGARRQGLPDRDACKLLSGTLMEMAFTDFAALTSDLYRKLRAPGGSEKDEAAAQALFHIAHQLAPALYDPGVVRIACEQCDSAALIELPAAMHSVAEFAVAAAGARAAEFRPRRDAMDQDPPGTRALPAMVPELGIAVTSKTISDKIEEHLIRKQMCGKRFDGRVFLDDLDEYLDTTFSPSGRLNLNRGESAQQQRDRWDGVDRALTRWGRQSRFYLVFRPTDEAEFETMKDTAMELKDRYRHLMILFLVAYRYDTSENPWDRDADQVFDFCQMLPIRGTSKP